MRAKRRASKSMIDREESEEKIIINKHFSLSQR